MKKFLSYFFPVKVKEYVSKINGTLEINLVNGKKILDTKTTNYSYGALQAVLKTGLLKIGFDHSAGTVLVLGMGGGSVVETIRKDFSSQAFIELVDIDPEVISIASSEFGLDRYSGISIVESDASVFMQSCTSTYDIIIVDLFVIDTIPHIFTTVDFVQILNAHLNPGGSILYNTLRETIGKTTFENLKNGFTELNLKVNVLERVGEVNDLIIAKKPF